VTAVDELNSLGVSFVSYQEQIDLTTPTGKLMFHIIAAMTEFERELIRERVKAGVANAHAISQRKRGIGSQLMNRECPRLHRKKRERNYLWILRRDQIAKPRSLPTLEKAKRANKSRLRIKAQL
jgi:DNA invertase Pin-like site-specific DNA recombinase